MEGDTSVLFRWLGPHGILSRPSVKVFKQRGRRKLLRCRFRGAAQPITLFERQSMSGRPALIRQRETKQIIAAAKKVGAPKVEVKIGEVAVIIHLNDDKDIAEEEQITL
jgi:hypothetical protein